MTQPRFNCSVEATLSLIGGKYKPLILWHLKDGPLRYMALQRLLPGAPCRSSPGRGAAGSASWASRREVIPDKPPKTIYSLTPFGESVVPVLNAMCKWGKAHMDEQGTIRPLNSEV